MSVLDKVIAAVTPLLSEESRKGARAMRALLQKRAIGSQWFCRHHEQLETAVAAVKAVPSAAARVAAQKKRGINVTGHSNAEEATRKAMRPWLHRASGREDANGAPGEDPNFPPVTQAYPDKVEHIPGAVAPHVYEEVGNWFLHLKQKAPVADQAKLTLRYQEEFER